MLRLALMLFFTSLSVLTPIAGAHAQDTWLTLATAEIDPRAAGSRVLVVGAGRGAIRALRLTASGTMKLSRIVVSPAEGAQLTKGGPVEISGAPVEIWSGGPARVIASVGVSWAADPTAQGLVKVTIEGLRDEAGTAKASGEVKSAKKAAMPSARSDEAEMARRNAAETAAREAAELEARRRMESERAAQAARRGTVGASGGSSAPAPAPAPEPPKAAAPAGGSSSDRGITGAQPPMMGRPPVAAEAPRPAPAPAPAPPPPPVVASAPASAGPQNVCIEQKVCTIVDVFFGSTRNQVQGKRHISFGFERPNTLTLGHTFVTVPKINRERGSIPVPTLWQRVMGVPPEGDPSLHFTIPVNGVKVYASEEAFLEEAKKHIAAAGEFKDHAFIYVHGFAVSFENAMYRAAQISYDLSTDGRPFGTAFVYTWPSKGSVLPTAYAYDQDSADYAVPQLRDFIKLVTEKTGVKNVHIIAHSMGNRVLMRTLDEIARTESGARINQVILAAPDVDKQQFEQLAKNVGRVAKGLTLYASQGDAALQISRRARGDGAPPRAGEVAPPAGPAIVPGVYTIDISGVSTSVFDFGHDRYADSPELLSDIGAIFRSGVHPPTARSSLFKLTPFGTLQYWKYVKPAAATPPRP